MIAPTPRRILFFTNSEYGQANVVLSVAHELALRRSNVAVHIASFSVLLPRIEVLRGAVRALGCSADANIHFHPLNGVSMTEAWAKSGLDTSSHSASISGAFESLKRLPQCLAPWSEPEYAEVYSSCVDIIKKLEAHAIVIESLSSQAIDACCSLGLEFIILSPNSPKDFLASIQPYGSIFWKYPITSSGISYPVPWYHIPKNILLACAFIYSVNYSTKIQKLDMYRHKNGLTSTLPIFAPCMPQAHYLCPATPKTDFPCVVPNNVTLCGPILVPASPLEEDDRELAAWLDLAPTVLVNLGTLVFLDEKDVRQVSMGLHILLDHDCKVQVIWKLKVQNDVKASLHDILGAYIESGRVRVVDWLDAEPLALLRHRNLVCTVSHGGANSFFEAIFTGVPQVILPAWYDCYDYAARVEWLGVGIYGNKNAMSGVEAVELGRALTRIVGDGDEAVGFRAAAKELAEDTQRYSGRVIACDKILELASR